MSREALQSQLAVKVDVIETEKREASGERSRPSQMVTDVGFVEMGRQRGRHGSAQPLIEISKDDSRPVQFFVGDDSLLEQFSCLSPLLEESRPEVNVEDMQRGVVEADIGPQAPSILPSTGTDVVVLMALYWEPSQDDVAVASALVAPVFAKREMETEFAGNESRLVFLAGPALVTDNFLKRNNIRSQLTQNVNDPIRTHPSVYATTFVYVVSNDSKGRTRLCHATTAGPDSRPNPILARSIAAMKISNPEISNWTGRVVGI